MRYLLGKEVQVHDGALQRIKVESYYLDMN